MTNTENHLRDDTVTDPKAAQQAINAHAMMDRLAMIPPTRQADFQAFLLARAAEEIDPTTWARMVTEAHAFSQRDPWS